MLPTDAHLPRDTVNVAYMLLSPSSGKLYIGSTKHIRRRVRQHRARAPYIGGAVNPHKEMDWVVVAYVHGFGDGSAGRKRAYRFEYQWQHTRWVMPRTRDSCIDLARMLIASWDLQNATSPGTHTAIMIELLT